MLEEYFNITNQPLTRFRRHETVVNDIQPPSCIIVTGKHFEDRCEYIHNTHDCIEEMHLVNYNVLIYCTIGTHDVFHDVLGIFLLFTMLLYLFIIILCAAHHFFCPALTNVAKLLNLNQDLAGVTLLAFGNSAPDAFVMLMTVTNPSEVLFNDLICTALFITTVVTGAICLSCPFKAHPSIILRDYLFLLLDLLLMDYSFKNGTGKTVTINESITILSLYVFYIIVVITDQALLRREMRRVENIVLDDDAYYDNLQHEVAIAHRYRRLKSAAYLDLTVAIQKARSQNFRQSEYFNVFEPDRSPNESLYSQFWGTISESFNMGENICSSIFSCMQMPIKFCLILIIPMVNYGDELLGWSKLLNCLQVCFTPIGLVLFFFHGKAIFFIPAYMWCALISIPLGFLIFVKTRSDTPPRHFDLLSILTVITSVTVIYVASTEVKGILRALGIALILRNSFLGSSLLTWGNSASDLINNVAISRHGFPHMGYSACLGGPLINTLVIMGCAFLYGSLTSEDNHYEIGEGTIGESAYIYAAIIIFHTVFAILCTNFVMRRSIGVFMITMYVLFFIFTLLGELEIIHFYGTDHRYDFNVEIVRDLLDY